MTETQFTVERAHVPSGNSALDKNVVTQDSDDESSSVGSSDQRVINASRGDSIHCNNGCDLMSKLCETHVHVPLPHVPPPDRLIEDSNVSVWTNNGDWVSELQHSWFQF